MRGIQSNEQIYLRHFWEHATFLWRAPGDRVNPTIVGHLASYIENVEKLSHDSIKLMRNAREQTVLSDLLASRHGGLFPQPSHFAIPASGQTDIAAWQGAFDILEQLFGAPVATRRRLKQDLKKYGTRPSCLDETLEFSPIQDQPWHLRTRDGRFDVLYQEFPREHLYRLEKAGVARWEFDGWPVAWPEPMELNAPRP